MAAAGPRVKEGDVEKSESIAELVQALVRVQAALKPAVRDKPNPFLKSRYADLAGVWDACRGLLHENRLAVIQVGGTDAAGHYLETILVHESGQWISGRYPLRPVRADDPQALGSALTYARRYSLAAVLGIVTEDDDGEGTIARPAEKTPAAPAPSAEQLYPALFAHTPVSAEQLDRLEALQKAGKNIRNVVDVYKWKVARLSELTYDQAATLIRDLGREAGK